MPEVKATMKKATSCGGFQNQLMDLSCKPIL